MADHEHYGNYFFTGLILGTVVGVGLTFFLMSDERTKKKLKKKGKIALDNLTEIVSEFKEEGEEFKRKTKKLQAELEEKTKDVRETVAEEAETQLAHIEKLRERGRKATRRFFTRAGKKLT
jgi:gas vesicle protein